jgi:hypothetical protein
MKISWTAAPKRVKLLSRHVKYLITSEYAGPVLGLEINRRSRSIIKKQSATKGDLTSTPPVVGERVELLLSLLLQEKKKNPFPRPFTLEESKASGSTLQFLRFSSLSLSYPVCPLQTVVMINLIRWKSSSNAFYFFFWLCA